MTEKATNTKRINFYEDKKWITANWFKFTLNRISLLYVIKIRLRQKAVRDHQTGLLKSTPLFLNNMEIELWLWYDTYM